ncbi:casein kinase substrate phosphoprotein PP28 domain-containing protein [Hirsutella rhossiliensis]|uniref:Casein kinase substrate phosphoprotein PP28 domain-containing protein n=1 Tax=Hirsutella rhossiliensis TaxID=111463 RepID=A0A9P8MMW6_9HYPO|nr:casein kinase substrate phosphoprotein PP28 domain-containing protein [Hirsutella rhossiliensis]KAH0958005.1 casein kinase substrate phosphoprotein PP28 domain-containing protein [Hirsutella rhossiliensis]
MAGGTGTANARRAGKYNKPTRGGGKHFSRSLQPVDKDGNLVSIWSKDSQAQSDEDDESSSEEEEENGAVNDAAGSANPPVPANDREARKAQKKARQKAALAKQNGHTVEPGDLPSSDESDDADMPANPNHSRAAHSMTQQAADASDDGEKTNAKERYLKLQAQGKTDEAKADMARLKLIREQREAEAARRQAEKEEKEEQDKARRAEIEARDAKRREAAAGPKKGKKK